MTNATGIHADKNFKLGKAPAKIDQHNLMFAKVLKVPPALPLKYDFDTTHPSIPLPMFANDKYGCCVISGRAHQTLRFEYIEQDAILQISDEEVVSEYLRETGGDDVGLIVLDSLKRWRSNGWFAGAQNYSIRAFAEINRMNHDEVRAAIFSDLGVGIGVQLPKAAQEQLNTGQAWDVTDGPGSEPNSWGGHYVYVVGYTPTGPVCVTWGRKQQITWAWLDKYCDEAYAIFDAKNTFKKELINQHVIENFLSTVSPKEAAEPVQ